MYLSLLSFLKIFDSACDLNRPASALALPGPPAMTYLNQLIEAINMTYISRGLLMNKLQGVRNTLLAIITSRDLLV